MRTRKSLPQFIFSSVIVFILVQTTIHPTSVLAQESGGVKRQINAQTGKVSFLLPESGLVLPAREAFNGSSLAQRSSDPALALVQRFGSEFGLKDASRELVEKQTRILQDGKRNVRFQQVYRNVPVLGGELLVRTNANGDLYSINGEVAADLTLNTEPAVSAGAAAQAARALIAKGYKKQASDFTVTTPALWIFDASLIMDSNRPPQLVWRMEVTAFDATLPVRELVLVDAQRGQVTLHFNQIDTAWSSTSVTKNWTDSHLQGSDGPAPLAVLTADVATYTASNGTLLPGTFLCAETQPACTNGSNPHADKAHAYAIGTYDMYATQHGRDSLDNAGTQLISTVHYDLDYQNAFWSGTQMVYGDGYGFPLGDDVVAHELTHGVTQHESNLFYFYQSGAINESFSDIWGEFYDQTNGQGTDTAAVAWQIGEDISGLGAIRDMRDPAAFSQPDKMSSSLYAQDEFDNGGVHTNSGVNNKAAYLMVTGGTFNGKTISALGWVKTAAIYYETNTNLLTSGSDYSDLYFALQTACASLIGQKGITTADCVDVKDAIEAVEMQTEPVPGFNTDAPYCDAGDPSFVFSDGIESGTANWTFSNGARLRWQVDSVDGPFAYAGNHSLFADDIPEEVTDATARLKPLLIPSGAYLHFSHAYQLESFLGILSFDGGVLEYSTNGGSSWQDAGFLIDVNGYNGSVEAGSGNPIEGRSAFVGSSHGYISTRLDLGSLAGQNVVFRWRLGLDSLGSGSFFDSPSGWWLDDVKLYTCGSPVPGDFNRTAPAQSSTNVPLSTTLTWSSSPLANYYQYCYDLIDDNQCNRTWSTAVASTSANITNLGPNTEYFWQVRAINTHGVTEANEQAWGSFQTTSTVPANTAVIETFVGNSRRGRYSLGSGHSLLENYSALNNGPVKILSTNSLPFAASERVIYRVSGVNTSFSEMTGLPNNQLDTTYWLPWYNNVDLDTQLRIGNVSNSTATVKVYIAGTLRTPTPITLAPGASTRQSFAGVNNGPVKIVSTQKIVAAERVIYKVGGVNTSFSEMMALPNAQLSNTYWLPWYNNVDLDTQLRLANVSASNASVRVFIGGTEVQGSPFTLPAGASIRKSFPGINNGPVKIISTQLTVAAERVIYKVGGVNTSFSEMMALPNSQLSNTYWLPWYSNSGDHDTQLRIANVSAASATIRVYIGGVEMQGSPFALGGARSARLSFPGINSGPVRIVSTQPIIAAERVIFKVNSVNASFSETMGLPSGQLNAIIWLPWYNSVDLDTQLRFGLP